MDKGKGYRIQDFSNCLIKKTGTKVILNGLIENCEIGEKIIKKP